jgi:predicted hotdog family 3-hydroxylacyl-ACP dehydratase
MVMIDTLTSAGENKATGKLHIADSNLFCEGGFLAESGMMEFIAQTAAAYIGFRNKQNTASVTEGYIGAIKNLVIYDLPPVNSEITSGIVLENEIVGYTIITGNVFFKERLMASCEMRILGTPL